MLAASSSHRDPMQTRAGAEKPNGGVSRRAYSNGYNVPYGSFAAPRYFVKPVVSGCHFPPDLLISSLIGLHIH